ncbi:MAG: 4-alpha-glucanotransferase [Bacteroidetes bacterium GWC2_33_15]|nr:MAG: 4-alpha-glucanotransferase [Bacteroidetes bacterium GWA2_33_15]OFX51165.1 MAG: 4-alpha-glucanotransferase [Bacteroidetes bacterium GWC2_33_15]OFX66402.1 MAG: 4-alpha-glucanotransferase [Bacteroidetes bacterium GWB2_32_14]OFX70373.1 MAG: 4-alpha-glucanotransferase [Bacteroidetes bacterium GWD2_33_33]HAN17379.1 4-alpha-glucanotransferase [Bacteroidales bacterium]
MRILMFGWEFPPHITGGLGTACYGLVKGLAKNGVEVSFVVPKAYGDEDYNVARILSASDIEVNRDSLLIEDFWKRITMMEIGSNLIPYVSPEEFTKIVSQNLHDKTDIQHSIFRTHYQFSGKYGKDLMEEVSRYAVIASILASKNNFDIVHAHDWLTYPAGIAAKSVSGKPLVIHVHATEFDRSGENINQNVFDIERKGMMTADRVICVSNYTRNIVIHRYGINESKVFTVHNAVEFDKDFNQHEWHKSVPEKVVTFLGRVTFQKGPDYFVEAANRVLSKYKNVRFVMAGSGDMLNRMVRRVAELRISEKFHFTGFLKGDDVNRMFMQSDLYVMPSVSEPFGISPLEAMRANVPVIISKQSGVAEVLKHAIKVDFWDIDAMADAIHGIIHYDALSRFFRRMGQEEVLHLKWENAALQVKEIYNSFNA